MPDQFIKIKLLLLFFLGSNFLFSQHNKSLDSLLLQLKKHTASDSVRANLLIKISSNSMHEDPNKAMRYVDEALNINQAISNKKGEAYAYRQFGNIYYVKADNLGAMEVYQKALGIAKIIRDSKLEISLYNNLGNIYADLKQNKKALENYNALLKSSKEQKDNSGQIKALCNIGIIYNDMDMYSDAILNLKKALSIADIEKNNFYRAAIINNIGLVYKDKKDYKSALENYSEAILIAESINNKYILASSLNSIGKVNLLLGNFDVAQKNAEKALQIAIDMDAVEWQADSWKVISTALENFKKDEEALYAYKKYIVLRDSVLSEEKKSEITRNEMQFQLERQEDEAEALINEQKIIKNFAFAGGAFLLLTSAIGYLLYKRKRDALYAKKMAEFKTKVAETELKALRSQMNPHFIFNALNSISDYISKNEAKKANEYLLKFARLTRAILENSEKKTIFLDEDLELLELYVQIESLRVKNKINYKVTLEGVIEPENILVPSMILQPFIENSIWHGIAKKETAGHIEVNIKEASGMLVCSVKDNGGRSEVGGVKINPKKSLGVNITKSRIEILNQLKKIKGSVVTKQLPDGYFVELKFPLEFRF